MSPENKLSEKPVLAITAHAHGRTQDVRIKLKKAMDTIEVEIEQNQGIYPMHGGRLSLSEICRRAGVHKITMQSPSHKTTTKLEVEKWLAGVRSSLKTGRKTVRKIVTQRANDWQQSYTNIANKFNEMYAIEIPSRNAKIKKLTERNEFLEAECLRLQAALSEGKVVRIPDIQIPKGSR